MTRFARAKGSKASNERLPEEATSWSEMKQQLLEKNKEIEQSKKKQAFLNQRNANYKAFLEERTEDEMKKSQWAEFPSENIKKNSLLMKNNNKNEFDTENDIEESDDEAFTSLKAKVDEVLKKSENKTRNNDGGDSDSPPEEHSSKVQISNPKVKKPKNKKIPINIKTGSEDTKSEQTKQIKKKVAKEKAINKNDSDGIDKLKKKLKQKPNKNNPEENVKKRKINEDGNDQSKPKKLKKDKANIKAKQTPKEKIPIEDLTEADLKKIEKKKQKRIKQLEKKKLAKIEKRKQKEEEEKRKLENGEQSESTGDQVINSPEDQVVNAPKEINNTLKQGKFEERGKFQATKNRFEKFDNTKGKKERDNKEHQRRKPFLPTKMMINGKEVDVDYVDGFPVKKEDAQRLKKLRKEMISKGLPRSEINVSLKLERRKAEKAFAREKKKVCFNCRTSGHNLSECPELGKDQVAPQISSGICFKCGSTEHTHFECKVVRGQEFKFAQCFICNEQGHIARQCPDNQRGLYPKGGACRVCGDVTHLKRDCPKYQAEQQQIQNSLSIETIGDSNPDVLDDKNQFKSNNSLGNRRPNKIVKF